MIKTGTITELSVGGVMINPTNLEYKPPIYTHAIGTQGNGGRLHMLQGHKRGAVTYWQPICRLDTPPATSCYPMYYDCDESRVTCRKCQRALKKIADERRTGTI